MQIVLCCGNRASSPDLRSFPDWVYNLQYIKTTYPCNLASFSGKHSPFESDFPEIRIRTCPQILHESHLLALQMWLERLFLYGIRGADKSEPVTRSIFCAQLRARRVYGEHCHTEKSTDYPYPDSDRCT